eukprot:2670597-Pleurochrysis_carterae.AAC.1
MGMFDDRCRHLVMEVLQLANTNNVALFDKISVSNGGPPIMETEERLWECGRYASFHVAPLAGASGKRFPLLPYTPVGFKTMVALPTVYKVGFGQAPVRIITELYRAAVTPDGNRAVPGLDSGPLAQECRHHSFLVLDDGSAGE